MRINPVWSVGFLFTVAACGTTHQQGFIPLSRIENAQANIAEQVAVYQVQAKKAHSAPQQNQQQAASNAAWCGDGDVDFAITSIKVDLQTTVDTTSGLSGEGKPPIGPGVSLDIKAGASRDDVNNQELIYTVYPLPDAYLAKEATAGYDKAMSDQELYEVAPIAAVILRERTALINSALKALHPTPQSCMVDFNPLKPTDQNLQLTIGLKSTVDRNGSFGLTLGVVTLGANADSKNTKGSSVTVNFQQVGVTSATQVVPCSTDPSQPCVQTPDAPSAPQAPGAGQPGATTKTRYLRSPSEFEPALLWAVVDKVAASPGDSSKAAWTPGQIIRTSSGQCIQYTMQGVWVPAPCASTTPKPVDAGQCKEGHTGTLSVPQGGASAAASTQSVNCSVPTLK